jgi:hypothetical protein
MYLRIVRANLVYSSSYLGLVVHTRITAFSVPDYGIIDKEGNEGKREGGRVRGGRGTAFDVPDYGVVDIM